MLLSKVMLVILAVLSCSLKICSGNPDISTKSYRIPRQIRGKYQVDQTTLAYVVCEHYSVDQSAGCTVTVEYDVFDYAEASECPTDISTQWEGGKLDILGVQLWNRENVLFAWRDIGSSSEQGILHIQNIEMDDCSITEKEFEIDIRPDQKSQEHIIPSGNTYDVTFLNYDQCGEGICKVTVDRYGQFTDPVTWFYGTDLIHALEPIPGTANHLLITHDDYGNANLYLIDDTNNPFLTSNRYGNRVGWSSTYDTITFCGYDTCSQYDYNGLALNSFRLTNISPYYPYTYKALHNLPNGELLALTCYSGSNRVHQVIKIGTNGRQNYYYRLDEIRCNPEPVFFTSSLYRTSSGEYCLSLFYSIGGSYHNLKFSTYCFTF